MANNKISELAELTTIAEDDYLPVVDTSETATKRIAFSNLHKAETKDHCMQSDSTDQVIAAGGVTDGQVITFNTDVDSHGVERTSSSRFTIKTVGSYLICFSGICQGNLGDIMGMWLRVGTGVGASTESNNVANSTTYYTFKGNQADAIMAVSFIYEFAVDEWFEFWCWGSYVTRVLWNATAAVAHDAGQPARPACPSIIFTASRI